MNIHLPLLEERSDLYGGGAATGLSALARITVAALCRIFTCFSTSQPFIYTNAYSV
jgi:hypothetical protein